VLLELLSPNRMPSDLQPRAAVVRAVAEDGLDEAEREIHDVSAALTRSGFTIEPFDYPMRAEVRAGFDKGLRVFHFVGHGLAQGLGESLPVGSDQEIRPSDFSELGGARTPLAFLNACEVG